MKKIFLPTFGSFVHNSNNPVNIGEAIDHQEVANANRNTIILSALGIEELLEEAITTYLIENNLPKRKFFNDWISSSDWFTFSAKRKVLLAIIQEEGLLKGPQKTELENKLSKVIKYRNAFTHGSIIETSTTTILEYYEGEQKQVILNDEYWIELETIFKEVFDKVWNINHHIQMQ